MAKVKIKFVGSEEYEIFDLPDEQTYITSRWFKEELLQKGILISNIETVSMEGVISIGQYAFRDCTGLTEVIIPASVTSIGNCAFWGCTSLKEVIIPASVTSIGDGAFSVCTSLKEVIIPASVTEIKYWAFGGCTSLASVIIPGSVTSIGGWAFRGCTSLASVIIPAGVTSVGLGAFYGCTGLTEVTIPASVTEIEPRAFEGCTGLERIIVHTAAQQQMLMASNSGIAVIMAHNSGIAEDKIVCLPELTEDNKEKYRITYSEFANLNSKEQTLYLDALDEYRAQSENAESTGASGGESKEFLNILSKKHNDATRQHVTQLPKNLDFVQGARQKVVMHAISRTIKTAEEYTYRGIAKIVGETISKHYDPKYLEVGKGSARASASGDMPQSYRGGEEKCDNLVPGVSPGAGNPAGKGKVPCNIL